MEEDELDPRIQVELEKLNTATDEINRLEIELDEANTTFRMLLGECTRRLKVHSSKHGSAIVAARPYYEALDAARSTQQACQKAAVGFQRANEIHEAAKETVALAEARFLSQPDWRFDSAWQEMLNHATLKVRDAEKQRAESAAQHGAATARYKEAQDKVHNLEQRLKRNVAKSRPYFEEKARCNDQLAAQKEVVESLQRCVANTKRDYANSLRRLEGISEEIHRKRADIMGACPGIREPGVGAELDYRGELDRCDVQSGGSTAYDTQSDCGSEGLVEGAASSGAEIREAVVSTVEMLGAAGNMGTSTKQTQQRASTSVNLSEDFSRAQISNFRSPDVANLRRNDYLETDTLNMARSSKQEEANEDQKRDNSLEFSNKIGDSDNLKSSDDDSKFERPRLKEMLAEIVSNNKAQEVAGDFTSEHSNILENLQETKSFGDCKDDPSNLVTNLKQEESKDREDSRRINIGESKAGGDSEDSELSVLKSSTSDASEGTRESWPNEDINGSVNKDVNAGASVAQNGNFSEVDGKKETIESADNNPEGEETLRD